jgi:acetyl esterase/lipase
MEHVSTGRRTRLLRHRFLLVLGALGAAGVLRRWRAVSHVSRDLRSPLLYVPGSIRNGVGLKVARQLGSAQTRIAAGVGTQDRSIDTEDGPLAVVTYERPDRRRSSGALLWIHGGGLVMGHPPLGHEICSRFADELGILVASVDYRLAPEYPFPAGLEDCYAALCWLHDTADELGVDVHRIAVGGDSAGGGLAAALTQLARDRGGPEICFQLLVYPMLDDRSVLRADHEGRGRFVWTPASNRFGWTAYLGHPPAADDDRPHASAARCPDLSGLPPAWIGVGDLDLFYAEDCDYARRLQAAGVPCALQVEPGMYHGAEAVRPKAPAMRAFRAAMLDALRAAL